jgi:hypothetical protein
LRRNAEVRLQPRAHGGGQNALPPFIQRAAQMGGDGLERARLQAHFGVAAQQTADGLAHLALMPCDPRAATGGQKAVKFVIFLQHVAPVRHGLQALAGGLHRFGVGIAHRAGLSSTVWGGDSIF